MKHMYYSKLFTIIISFTLLIAPLPLMAITEEIIDSLSAIEKEILINNKDKNYIYLGENLDNIKTIIAKIKILDPYKESILDNFNDHIAKGFLLISTHDLLETLQYANQVIEYNYHKSDNDELKKITNELQSLTMTVLKKDLITDQNSDNELITRKHFKTLRIKKHLHVAGKSHFNKDMHAKQDISAKGKLHIRKSGHFGQGLRVDGMLSTGDAIINSLSSRKCDYFKCDY